MEGHAGAMALDQNRRRLITALRCGVYPQQEGPVAATGHFCLSSLIITLFAPLYGLPGPLAGQAFRRWFKALCAEVLGTTPLDLAVYTVLAFSDVADGLEQTWFPQGGTFMPPTQYFIVQDAVADHRLLH